MKRNQTVIVAALLMCVLLAAVAPGAQAGFVDGLKKKVTDKVTQKADEKSDKVLQGDSKKAAPAPGDAEEAPAAKSGSGSGNGKVSSVSTKFDFVPGDRVLFMEDFRNDDVGEFPARWQLSDGTFEVAEMGDERWLRCVSNTGAVRMKVPASLPEFWTLEFDFFDEDRSAAIALTVSGMTAGGSKSWESRFPYSGDHLSFGTGSVYANTPFEGDAFGRHHVAFMARGTALKVYVDRQRMANVPDVTAPGVPTEIELRLGSPAKPMISNVRFAEGCRPAKDLLAEGKLVTHAIRFATGSDVVLPESAPILRQVASYLDANPSVNLRITGHTDNVGAPASNLTLSQRRAASVAKVLSTEFGVAAERFETDGKGDTQTMASNAKPEGRAMNRRVEFAKR